MARVTRRTAVKRIPRKPKALPEQNYSDQQLRSDCINMAFQLNQGGHPTPGTLTALAQEIYSFIKCLPWPAASVLSVTEVDSPSARLYTDVPEEIQIPVERASRFTETPAL